MLNKFCNVWCSANVQFPAWAFDDMLCHMEQWWWSESRENKILKFNEVSWGSPLYTSTYRRHKVITIWHTMISRLFIIAVKKWLFSYFLLSLDLKSLGSECSSLRPMSLEGIMSNLSLKLSFVKDKLFCSFVSWSFGLRILKNMWKQGPAPQTSI